MVPFYYDGCYQEAGVKNQPIAMKISKLFLIALAISVLVSATGITAYTIIEDNKISKDMSMHFFESDCLSSAYSIRQDRYPPPYDWLILVKLQKLNKYSFKVKLYDITVGKQSRRKFNNYEWWNKTSKIPNNSLTFTSEEIERIRKRLAETPTERELREKEDSIKRVREYESLADERDELKSRMIENFAIDCKYDKSEVKFVSRFVDQINPSNRFMSYEEYFSYFSKYRMFDLITEDDLKGYEDHGNIDSQSLSANWTEYNYYTAFRLNTNRIVLAMSISAGILFLIIIGISLLRIRIVKS